MANDQRNRIANVAHSVEQHKFAMSIQRLSLIRNNDGNNGDGQGKAPEGCPTGRAHEQGHVFDYTGILTWPSSCAYIDPGSNVCTNRQQRITKRCQSWEIQAWITARWCYDWRYQVTQPSSRALDAVTGIVEASELAYQSAVDAA